MRAIIFGASGMLGGAVLRECLLDDRVERVLVIGRRELGKTHDKLRERVLPDLTDYSSIAGELAEYDACFFCLGVTSSGLTETEYRKVTHDTAVAAGRALAAANPSATFVLISGAGSNANSKTMWARVKGETENAILALPLRGKYAIRPAFVQPKHGVKSRTRSYRLFYLLAWPFYPLLRLLAPRMVTTSERLARAMIQLAVAGGDKPILETRDVNVIM